MTLLSQLTELFGDIISYVVLFTIALGATVTLVRLLVYLVSGFNQEKAAHARQSFMIYLSIALDFLIAKDILLTLGLNENEEGYSGVIRLLVVISIRVLLSYFIHFEEHQIGKNHFMNKVLSSPKKRTSSLGSKG